MKTKMCEGVNGSAPAGATAKAEGCKSNQVEDLCMNLHEKCNASDTDSQVALIPVNQSQVGDDLVQTVNARELHAFLEVGKVFAAWIQDRIQQYEFVDGVDYVVTVSKTGIRKNVTQKDYFITLDMAKELSMVERNAKGKQARQYFIQCERVAKSPNNNPMLVASTMNSDQLALLMGEVKRREAVQRERDEAIRTKACISSSREASVMAKLGHTKRENEALKEQLGVGTKHKSVKGAGLEQFYIDESGNRRQTANRLKKLALAMGVAGDIIDIEDPNYGTVKAYPVSVIERFKLEVAA
ncbi:antA/AntB antirepressor family protein [Aeromonas veronii]|uniref:antA/AntB antirepressor family protein n=2 Tax=Aeromonas veronii TaxID=654 RepID=UPI001FD69D09|nr:antA/AntB antirepressor family protein [Aeromonas veronii]MCR3957508.1 antA/AntB antirepressor family protein [Aeromonas veronii]UOR20888.1 antA/AntB antirepressor family protein [Aeromonas veronii]